MLTVLILYTRSWLDSGQWSLTIGQLLLSGHSIIWNSLTAGHRRTQSHSEIFVKLDNPVPSALFHKVHVRPHKFGGFRPSVSSCKLSKTLQKNTECIIVILILLKKRETTYNCLFFSTHVHGQRLFWQHAFHLWECANDIGGAFVNCKPQLHLIRRCCKSTHRLTVVII